MSIDERVLEAVLLEMRRRADVERRSNVFSTGLTMSSGRAVGVIVEEALSVFRVSDGGDAWTELVMGGYADPRPTLAEREKLIRVCAQYGTRWDAERREVFALAQTPIGIADCSYRVAAASIAIDGWRAWYPPRQTRDVNSRRIVDHVLRMAPHRGWSVDRTEIVRGAVRAWAADVMMVRGPTRAAVEIATDRTADHLMQRITGFLYDVRNTGLVVVVPKRIDDQLQGTAELRANVAVVPRLPKGTPRAIIEAAERVAIAA